MESIEHRLRMHGEARERWLAAAVATLEENQSVEAAILYGSCGRGDTDAWSDVDIVVFLADSVIGDSVTDRMGFPDQFGDAVYKLDSRWNAPIDGAQVNALYVLESGLPLYVDWNLWPSSRAGLPVDTRLVFSRLQGDIPASMARFAEWSLAVPRHPRPVAGKEVGEFVRHAHFGMVPLAAKFAARRNRAKLVDLLTGIGAKAVPLGVVGEMSAIRERLDALSPGEPSTAVAAVEELCDAAQAYLTSDSSAP